MAAMYGSDRHPARRDPRAGADLRTARRQVTHPQFGRDLFCLFFRSASILVAGGVAAIVIVAADLMLARTLFLYCRAFIAETPLLAPMIMQETSDEIELRTGVTLGIVTCNHRTARGRTALAVLADEASLWKTDELAP